MKHISKLFICFVAISFVFQIVLGGECDGLQENMDGAKRDYDLCVEDNMLGENIDCSYFYENRRDWVTQYNDCMSIEPKINNAKESCPDIAGKINRYSYSFLNKNDCCFNNHYTQPYCGETNNNSGGNNTGGNNTGSTNTGSTNTGSTNTGSTNTGSTNTGSTNTGSTNTGSTNTGSTNTGGNNNTGSQQGYASPNCAPNLSDQSSNNGCTNYSSAISWYCNNGNGINLYMNNHDGTSSKQESQSKALNQYKNFYNSGNSEKIGARGFNSPGKIWNLQKLLGVGTDCKLGNTTMDNFFATDFCKKINSTRTTSSGSSCPEGKEVEGSCCKPSSCEKISSGGSCDIYGSGYKLEENCCVFDCSEGKQCDPGEKRSTGTCKCECDPTQGCCGVQLNMVVPFIGDCIELSNNTNASYSGGKTTVNQLNAFPVLMKGLSKIVVTIIMIFSIIVVVIAGLLMTTSVANESNYKKGLEMLRNVAIALILLGTSGLILRLINPTFFGG